ncbi:hypothetical protein CDAR_18641 [Caerostris darwini]|uniref:Uncharacterized protein n=1 Tax=Caerostris darwini TaxID=1538125 RepID=A0AAV4RJA5_9ARAC|nr:hypothetical protein CDAR_18641 [Caerostris darwini]
MILVDVLKYFMIKTTTQVMEKSGHRQQMILVDALKTHKTTNHHGKNYYSSNGKKWSSTANGTTQKKSGHRQQMILVDVLKHFMVKTTTQAMEKVTIDQMDIDSR